MVADILLRRLWGRCPLCAFAHPHHYGFAKMPLQAIIFAHGIMQTGSGILNPTLSHGGDSMNSYRLFDIIGPRMIGPSSSHTAGAVRLGNVASRLLSNQVSSAEITLYGSFSQTGKGHGTDKALIAGLMGFLPDDVRIPHAYDEARNRGIAIQLHNSSLEVSHPNTARICATSTNGLSIDMVGVSLGGGKIEIRQLNNMEVAFRCEYPTLLIFHHDQPGVIRQVTEILENASVNIAFMRVFRSEKQKDACMIIETDDPVPPSCTTAIRMLNPVIREVCTL